MAEDCFGKMSAVEDVATVCTQCANFKRCWKLSMIALNRGIRTAIFDLQSKFRYL